MNKDDVIRAYRGSAKKIEQINETNFPSYSNNNWKFSEFKAYIESNGLNVSNFLISDSIINNTFYADYEHGVYVECYSLTRDYFETFRFFELINQGIDSQGDFLNKKNYELFYFYIPKTMRVYDFQKRYKELDVSKVASTWEDIYTSIDYGFEVWDKEVLEYVFQHCKQYKSNKRLTIYRGIGTESTPIEKSYSWTTDLNVALWFAARSGSGHSIAKADVDVKNILFFVTSRKEKEVIVRYEDLENFEYMNFLSSDKDSLLSTVQEHLHDYRRYGMNLSKQTFLCGEHDKTHSARVLFYSLMLSNVLNLGSREKQILAYCSVLHDISRIHDGVDDNHGKMSVEMIDSESISLENIFLKDEYLYVAKKIIEYHCIDDEKAIDLINLDSCISDKDRAIKLYKIFKDCDCLDRVRFNMFKVDFDIKYLRYEESKRLLLMVAGLYKNKVHDVLNY